MNPNSRTLDIILQMQDRVSSELSGVADSFGNLSDSAGKAGQFIEDNLLKIGVASAAAGAGLEVMARQQNEVTRNLANLGVITGQSTTEMRDLATSLRNVTFPMSDVVVLLEAGARQGLETNEELARFANMWDMVSDATGIAAETLAKQSVALRRVGIDANNTEAALDAFGFVTKETSLDVDDLLNIIERRGREIETLGLNINQTAALMKIMQENTGASGRVLRQEFTRAVGDADGDLSVLLTSLGTTTDEFNAMTASVEGNSTVIEQMAQNYADSFTPMQRMQDMAARLTENYGDLIGVMASLTPILIALGPIIKGIIVLKGVLAGVTLAALAPYLLIAAAIAAVIAIGVLLYKNWESLIEITGRVVGFLMEKWGQIQGFFSNLWESVVGVFQGAMDKITAVIDGIIERAMRAINLAREAAGAIGGGIRSAVSSVGRVIGVNDAIISPKGDIITTHPDDYIIATKTPGSLGGGNGVTVNVYGDVSGRELVETVKKGIMGELKHNVRLTNMAY